VDPGQTTGVASVEVYRDDAQVSWPLHTAPIMGGRSIRVIGTGNIAFENAPRELQQLLEAITTMDSFTPVHVVAEKFVMNAHGFAGQALWSAQVTGMLIALAATLYDPLTVDTSQMPSAAKNVAPRKLLREMELLRPRMTQHEVDSLSHAVLHVVRTNRGKTSMIA